MLMRLLIISFTLIEISIGNAQDNNLFIENSVPAAVYQAPPLLPKPVEPSYLPAPPLQESAIPKAVQEEDAQFIRGDYWDMGTEEHLVESSPSEVVTSEIKLPSVVPVPTPRPQTKPKKKAPTPPKAKATTTPKSRGLRCEKPSGIASLCSQNGIREGLESVINDCGTVRCYLKLFHYETSCRPFLTHQAIVTAYGMCSIEKDRNLRKRFGEDCSRIDTVDSQIKCCRKMMKTVGRRYFEPVKVGRMPKCE